MDNRAGLLLFGVLIVLFVFTFNYSIDALAAGSVLYGVFALIGFATCVFVGFFQGMLLRKDGVSISWWFMIFGLISSIFFIWYLTRCGTIFGWW